MLALLAISPVLAEPVVSPVPDGRVIRAQFTTAVVDREPVDEILLLQESLGQVYFFTELRNLQGRTITHRWAFEGQVVSRKSFDIGGPRWRVFSSKTLPPQQYGEWSVTVVDQSGWPLYTGIFRYQAVAAADDPAAEAGSADTSGAGATDSGGLADTGVPVVTE
jgi:hypothetical protein